MQQRPPVRWGAALAALFLLVASVRAAGSTSWCDPETQVACRNHPHVCVDFEQLQDGTADCPDASDEDCQPWEFTCSCGQPRCISADLMNNGVLDCADGSDEGLIGGNCKSSDDLQDIDDLVRLRRATAVRVEVNAGQTTTFFLATDLPARSRPLGFITSTKGAFVNEGTTTEYTTQIVGTSIEGTYAKIQNTQSRVYSVIPTESFGDLPSDQLPVGLFSSSLVTRIRGETTTVETTQFIRTFIDESYAQEILTTSEIFAPLSTSDDEERPLSPSPVNFQIIPTVVLDGSLADHEDPGKIVFQTSHLTSLVGERVIESSIAGPLQGASSSEEDTKAGDEDDKKIISAFVETVAPAADPSVVPAKPVVALETIVAGAPVAPVAPVEEAEKDASIEALLEADELTESATEVPNDEPVEITEEKPVSVLLQEIGETVAAAAELDQESSTESDAEASTEISAPKQSIDESEPSNREPRVELGAPISLGPARQVGATLQLRPPAPVEPTGLISSFEGSLVVDGTTTMYTSLIFGTVIDGEWANVVSTITTVILPSAALTVLPSAPVAILATPLVEERPVEQEQPAQPELEGSLVEPSVPVTETPTGLLPVTRLTTFTFFTTFFETREDTVVTSISTREVVSSEVQFVEETAKPSDLLDEMMALDKDMSPGDVVTQFTTFTYFSTLFDEETTRTFSRTEVVSNVLTVPVVEPTPTMAEASEAPKMDDKAPADVESSLSDLTTKRKNLFSSLAHGIVKTFFTTFTFFTTALVNGTTVVSSRVVVSSNAVTPTVQLTDIDEELWESLKAQDEARSRSKTSTVAVVPTEVIEPVVSTITSPALESEPEFMTTFSEQSEDTTEQTVESVTPEVAPVETTSESAVAPVSSEKPATEAPEVVSEAPIDASELPVVVPVSEQATESPVTEADTMAPEIEPSAVTEEPSAWPQTFYTTFTYFTTYFTGEVSNIVSHEETITNVVTAADELVEATVPPLPSVFPITYYTTYTYRTTSISDGETIVSTREETVSNVVTPTAAEASIEPSEITPIEITPTVDPGLTTFFTTFTYFTTSTVGDTSIITSSLETITNVVSDSQTIVPSATAATVPEAETVPEIESSTETNNGRNIGSSGSDQLIIDLSDDNKQPTGPTGLLSTIRSTKVNNGVTTVFTTDVLGTVINGQYARILESSSEVLNPRPPTTVIVAAAAVEGVEATDIFPGVTQSAELEGSIVQASPSSADFESPATSTAAPAAESESSDSEDDAKSDGKGGRITTRLSAPSRSRTFTPSIRPFTQRPRPPLPTRPRRPPFTNNAAEAEEPVVVASSVVSASSVPSSSSSSSSSSSTRSFSSRFRTSAASVVTPVLSSTSVEGSRGLFRSRVSSLLSISPTPVLSSGTSRRFSSVVSPIVSSVRSSLSLPIRRPGTLSSTLPIVRSSLPSVGVSRQSSSSINRFSRPSTLAPPTSEDDVTTEGGSVETSTSTAQTAATVANVRRPFTPRPRPAQEAQESTTSSPTSTPSGRRFPFSRASARPVVTEPPRNAISTANDAEGTTPKPRFVRPPKLTFTEKPRPPVRLPTRPGSRNANNVESSASNVEPVVVEAPNRSKRQTNFDYYYYDPVHYRRPSRGSFRRTGRTRSGSNRAIEVDYDYDQQGVEFDYDASEDERVVTTRPRTSSSSALRERLNSNKQSSSRQPVTTRPRTRTSPSSSRNSGVTRSRKPIPEEVSSKRFSPSSSRTRTDSSSRSRSKISSQSTTEKTTRRFGNTRRPSTRNRVVSDFREEEDSLQFINPTAPKPGFDTAPALSVPLSVTHKIPTETTIPVVNNGATEFKTVLTAKPSVEVLQQYTTSKVSGTWRYLASEISATPSPGVTVVTQFVLKPTETQTVTFTPTTIRGRPTSFSHILPSTAYEVETVISTMTDPLASTNNLLQQLLLSGLQQTPVTSFVTHTSTFVTTLTEFRSTKIPITLRGQEIFTTIVGTSTSVITATEFSTQTIVTGPTETSAANPLASLLPALLGNQLLQAQLLAPQLQQQSPVLPIQATQAPQLAVTQQPIIEEEEVFEEEPFVSIAPAKPIATTSVVTLFVSGRRPGEFSSIVSTVTLDGGDATVVKRQAEPSATLPLEPSELPFMVATDHGLFELPEQYAPKDLDFYIVSAISDISEDGIVSVGKTQHLKSDYLKKLKKADSHKLRKLRSIPEDEEQQETEIDELEEPLESVESQIDEVRVDAPSGARGTRRRKVVTVTRKLSVASGERTAFLDEDFVSNNRARKVVVVARRRPSGSEAVNDVSRQEDEADAALPPKKKALESKVTSESNAEPPTLSSSLVEPETEAPHRSGLFGDVFAPRTYLTVYSYFYTLLNGPSSGSVSSREVSISEIIRGSDSRIPAGFQRTENANGLYPLSTGRSIADLSTRVNSGITTQVNLASMTFVKYGRGTVRASVPVPKKEDLIKPVSNVVRPSQPRLRTSISPTPRLEPSFEALTAERDEETVVPTKRLQTARRTSSARGRAIDASPVVKKPNPVEETSVTKKAATGVNRGRGTVRFNAAAVLGDQFDSVTPVLNRGRNKVTSTVVRQRPVVPSAVVRRTQTTAVRSRPQPVKQNINENIDFDEEEEDFHDDAALDEHVDDEYYDDHHDGEEHEEDYHEEHEDAVEENDVDEPTTPSPSVSSSAVSATPLTRTTTKLVGVTPTRTTISRKTLNPLQSHLSSILANSRASLKSSSTTQTTNDPTSSNFFRSRSSKTSSVSAFQTSTVVYRNFQTLSTLPVDGGRSGIPLTLITSTLTTLFDDEISLITQSPDLFKPVIQPTPLPPVRPKPHILKPTARLSLPIRASVAIGNTLLPTVPTIESTIEDTTTEVNTESAPIELLPSIGEPATLTVVETQLKTFTAIVTRKSDKDEEVVTRLEVLPELVTRTVVQPTPVVDVQASIDTEIVPTPRAIPARDGREQILFADENEDRGGRLNIGSGRPQNFATKIMRNGVEVIVANDKKPTLLAQNVIQKSQTVIEPSPPITLAASTLTNQVTLASDIDNIRLLSSIQSDPARFQTMTQVTTFAYFTTFVDGASKVVSSREEVITNLVTQEIGRPAVQPTATVTRLTGEPGSYDILTQFTTYTYFNTFMDRKRPVVLTSKETVANVVTVPAGQSEPVERAFETSTYLRTYVFSSKLDRDAMATSKEVVTQIVVTEAPRLVRPTPVVTFTEVTKTYLNTVTLLTTEIEGTDSVVRRVTSVKPEIVVETIRDFEPTPVLEGSQIMPSEDEFEADIPLVATKTYFTTMTHFTTLQQGTKTIVQSHKEVKSSVVTETIAAGSLSASLFAEQPMSTKVAQDVKPTYVKLGPNLYGKLRTLFATATYFITNSVGEVTSKRLVVPQVTTETVPLSIIPTDAVIEPSSPLPEIETTPVPTSSQILSPAQLQSLKESFLAGQQSTTVTNKPSILSPEQLNSLKESFLASKPSGEVTDIDANGGLTDPFDFGASTDPTLTSDTDIDVDGNAQPPEIPDPTGATVIMVTNQAGEVLIVPTEILGVQSTTSTTPSSSSSSSSSSSTFGSISGGTLASIIGGLGTLGLTALGQSLAGNNPSGLNINLGPVFDAMTGVLSNGLIAAASRRNSTDRSDTADSNDFPLNQHLNTPPFKPSPNHPKPTAEPLFIPIGGLAGATESSPARDPQARRPAPQTFIPLKPTPGAPVNGQQRPQQIRRPEQAVPLQPGVPGSPLLRPGAPIAPQPVPVTQLTPPTGRPISFSVPPLQTGFTGLPPQLQGASRLPNAPIVQGVRPPQPPFVNGQNNIDRVQIDPSRPVPPGVRPPGNQFFAANGQPVNAPPLPGIVPPPANPPPPPNVLAPQRPINIIQPGSIVPGPDGKPVRIVPVPEGQQPPPGAGGQVFIRPVPVPSAPAQPNRPVFPAQPGNQPPVATGSVRFPDQPPRRQDAPFNGIQGSGVQMIASVVGENSIVATNIVAGDKTIVVHPNDPTPVLNPPSAIPRPVVIAPTAVNEPVVVATELPEAGGAIEGVGSILTPGLAPASSSTSTSESTTSEATSPVTPTHEFTFGSESGEADHTPILNIFSDSPSTEILPSVFEVITETEASPTTPARRPTEPQEPFGVTSVVMGPDSEFTTTVSRVEFDGRTALSTIVNQATTVNYAEPTSVPTTTTFTSFVPAVTEEAREEVVVPEDVNTFPSDSIFVPPTKEPIQIPSTTRRPITAAAPIEPPVAQDVLDNNKDNKAVLGGFGGILSVNQPATFADGCRGRCRKDKLEVCMYAKGQHDCVCRPGHSRSNPFETCTKTYTYQLQLVLQQYNNTMLHYDNTLKDEISPQYRSLVSSARLGLKQALMKTDLSDELQDSHVMAIHPTSESELDSDGVLVDFFVHLKKEQDEDELKNKLVQSLEANNYLLGDSDIVAARFSDRLVAQDFDECSHEGHHDCSENSECVNVRGTYRCECKPGFVSEFDENGHKCLEERQDCEQCNNHGRCVFEPETNEFSCICNKWFAGKECQINLKVVMIAVLAVGIFLILLVTAIIVVCCLRSRRAKGSISGGPSFLRYRGPSVPTTGTLDRSAIIRGDTSSEGSGNDNLAAGSSSLDGKARTGTAPGAALQSYRPYGETLLIPRAKHQHGPSTATSPGAAERGEASTQREHQLMDYLDGRGPKKVLPDRDGKMIASSEALSATGRTSVSSTSQFRESLEKEESAETGNSDKPAVDTTVSEVRSFDETTIHPATRRPAQYYQSDESENSNFDSL